MKFFLILAIHIAVASADVLERALPAGVNIEKCPRSDSTTQKCLIKLVNALRPNLKVGIPELKIPRIEPFKMKYLELLAEKSSLVLKGEASNIVAKGAGAFVLKGVKLDMNNYILEVHVYIPRLVVTADYMTHGSKLFLIGINGSGQFKGTFSNIDAIVRAQGHPVMRNGQEFAKIDDIDAKITFGKSLLESTPDSPSIKETQAAAYVKNNSKTVMDLLENRINEVAGTIIKQHMDEIFDTVPISDFLYD